jgi:hypothetical protein
VATKPSMPSRGTRNKPGPAVTELPSEIGQ